MSKATSQRDATPEKFSEFERFLSLFDQLIEHTFDYANLISKDAAYSVIPIDSDVNFLGTRVNSITIGALVRHLILAESHWIGQILEIENGGTIPFPDNTSYLDNVADGQALMDAYGRSCRKMRKQLVSFDSGMLEKTFKFAGRNYTGMGMLWSIHAHHAFHLGQMDLLMRQQNIEPCEYMEWPEVRELIG